jgi:glycosyltransferase involved in cell wall biosynthesis
MSMTADQITIAITVYSRRQYLRQAIASALNQTVPVQVIVVEDCGPDSGMQDFVKTEFGDRVKYFRNPKRRGLFGNWNACMDHCQTRWLSILHDDDYLAPRFVESMIQLSQLSPESGLYFGETQIVDQDGQPHPDYPLQLMESAWRRIDLEDSIWLTPFPFPGHLFRIEDATALGGFRETSQYCGDWEMWCNLIAHFGSSRSRALVAYQRQHRGVDRGTNIVVRSGRQTPLSYVQHKRVLHLLRNAGRPKAFARIEYQKRYAVPTRFLLRYGSGMSRRLLAYHWQLLTLSKPPHLAYASFQNLARLFGPGFLRAASIVFCTICGITSIPANPAVTLGKPTK